MAFPLVTLLVVALSALAPVALASPPDQIWIGGIFDGGDSDDVVVAATSSEGATTDTALPTGKVEMLAVGPVPPAASITPGPSSGPVFQGRAPPSP